MPAGLPTMSSGAFVISSGSNEASLSTRTNELRTVASCASHSYVVDPV